MPQNNFSGLTGTIAALNANFAQLWYLRDLITDNNYTAATPKLTISAAGYFGFNCTPDTLIRAQITAAGAASVPLYLSNRDATAGTEVRLAFGSSANDLADDRHGWIGFINTGASGAAAFRVATSPGGAPAGERMQVTGAGIVLVNRTSQVSGGRLEVGGNIVANLPGGAPTLGVNGDMSFQLVSNTSLKILVRGSDGVTRSATLTLA